MVVPNGLSAFPVTPADADGKVDVVALRRLVARLSGAGVDSIGLLGSTGTYPYLTRAERRRAIDAALAETGGRVPVLVGIGALRTDETLALAQDAKAAGATAGLLAAVSYLPLTEDEVFEHFSVVARSGLPLCVYDNFSTTHFTFRPELVGRLSAIDGVVAFKGTAPGGAETQAHLAALRRVVPDGFSVGASFDVNCTEAMIAGADVWYSVAGGLFPERILAIVRAVARGDDAEARLLDAALSPLWDLFRDYSSLRVVYACLDLLGLGDAAPPRPILPLSDKARRRIAATLDELDLRK